MVDKSHASLTGILVILIFVVSIIVLLHTCKSTSVVSPRLQSLHNIKAIGRALGNYQADHNGSLPYSLTNLVPEYLDLKAIDLLYPVWSAPSKSKLYQEGLRFPSNGAYVYLGEQGRNVGILIHERMDLWKEQEEQNDGTIAVLFNDLSASRVPINELRSKLEALKR